MATGLVFRATLDEDGAACMRPVASNIVLELESLTPWA